MNQDPPDPELLFGQLLIEKGLAKPEHVQECLELLKSMGRNGVFPLPRLGDVLRQKSYLNLETWQRTLRVEETQRTVSAPGAPRPEAEPLPPEARAPGVERFGKYIRTGKLGEGGMGEVWKAWDTELRRWVAIKFLKSTDQIEIARFRREARLSAQLIHPNIAAIFEAGDSHIVMQYVDGPNLPVLKPTDPKRIASILRDVSRALQYAHENRIVHRDIKPANIMLDSTGRVFVMDFGLAKSMSVDSQLSSSGAISGTPAYMSPEQATGSSGLDHRSDIYSLGATLYELLSGRSPFTGSSAYEVLRHVVETEPLPIQRLNPAANRDLRTIAARCMEKDPAKRYPTAGEVADEFDRFLRGEPILARPLSKSELLRRYLVRNRSVVIPSAIAGGLAVLIAVAVLAGHLRTRAEIRRGLAEAEEWENATAFSLQDRRENYLRARGRLNQILELERTNPRIVGDLARVNGKLSALNREEQDRIALDERLRTVVRVLVQWDRLYETLQELDSIGSDATLAADVRQRKLAEPWSRVRRFVESHASDPAAHAVAAWARWRLLREPAGEEELRKAASDPDLPYPALLLALGRLLTELELPVLDERAPLPGSAEILAGLDRASRARVWVEETKDEFELIGQAVRAFLRGDFAAVEAPLAEVIPSPDIIWLAADLRVLRARARHRSANGAGALDDQDLVARRRVWHPGTRFWLGRYRNGPPALDDFEYVLRSDPRCAPAHVRRGEILEGAGRFQDALAAYEEALKILPGDPEIRKRADRARQKAGG